MNKRITNSNKWILVWKLKILVAEVKLFLEQLGRKIKIFLTRMSREPSYFVRSRLLARVSSIFSRIDGRIDRVAARKFRFARMRVSVSRTPVAQRHRLTRHTRKVSRCRGYLVSARAGRQGGGGDAGVWKRRKKERKNSQRNALKCKPDPCEIRGPTTVPPTTTMPDRIFRAIRPCGLGERSPVSSFSA